jgi:hypothetical protein
MKKAESVCWMAAVVVPNSSAIVGSAGRYMSMESGPKAASVPRIRASLA